VFSPRAAFQARWIFGQNLLSFSPPDVPLGIEVMLDEVLHDRVHQLTHAAEVRLRRVVKLASTNRTAANERHKLT
jgi:hypothetical protein